MAEVMGLFERMYGDAAEKVALKPARSRPVAFRMVRDLDAKHGVALLFERPGTNTTVRIWSGVFDSRAECTAILVAAKEQADRLEFWGRLVLTLGAAPLDPIIAMIACKARKEAIEDADRRRKKAAARRVIHLYIRERKGRFYLDLERASDNAPEWSIRFDGRSERDRMCDWLRWQKPHFREYLAYAAANGDHALEKRLVDEMFETEARLKKEGRVAGGLRPLRMWRGE
jgi:hypothetical protein